MTAASRRGILGASVALLATAGATAPAIGATHPDAELIVRCGEIHRLQAICQLWNDDMIGEAKGDAANTEMWQHLQAIIPMPARTPAGVKAKAAALVTVIDALNGDCLLGSDLELALSLARDVAAVGVTSAQI